MSNSLDQEFADYHNLIKKQSHNEKNEDLSMSYYDYVDSIDDEIELADSETTELINLYRQLKYDEKMLKQEIEYIKNKILSKMNNKRYIFTSDRKYKVDCNEIKSNRFDSKSFKKDNESLYSKYVKQSVHIDFRVREVKINDIW